MASHSPAVFGNIAISSHRLDFRRTSLIMEELKFHWEVASEAVVGSLLANWGTWKRCSGVREKETKG